MSALATEPHRQLHTNLVERFLAALESGGPGPGKELGPSTAAEIAPLLLEEAAAKRVSDIHFEPHSSGARIRFRIDGVVWDVAHLTRDQARLVINQFKVMAGLDPVIRFTPRDAHASCVVLNSKFDLRLAAAPCYGGEMLNIRMLDPKRLERPIDNLGMSIEQLDRIKGWLEGATGMFLAAGPTGSGKTTTIYSLLQELKFADRIIVSLEDPVEYQIDGISQIQIDELHNLTFAEGAKSLFRLDPDYLMLGEIRDALSAQSAVHAAITGRVLMSTVHCRDAVGAVTVLRNWGLADREIAESLVVVVAQRLVRKLCPLCKAKDKATPAELSWVASIRMAMPQTIYRPVGCKACDQLGYNGRTALFELWRINESDYERILDHTNEHQLRQHLDIRDHRSLLHEGMQKVKAGITSLAEVRRTNGAAFEQLVPEPLRTRRRARKNS